jgi:hypothetical protein
MEANPPSPIPPTNHHPVALPGPTPTPDRDALALALQQLQLSIGMGRTMTWPNFRRLAQRTTHQHDPTAFSAWRAVYGDVTGM